MGEGLRRVSPACGGWRGRQPEAGVRGAAPQLWGRSRVGKGSGNEQWPLHACPRVSTRVSTSRGQRAPPPLVAATPGATPEKSTGRVAHVNAHVERRAPLPGQGSPGGRALWTGPKALCAGRVGSGGTQALLPQEGWPLLAPAPLQRAERQLLEHVGHPSPTPPGCPDPSITASALGVLAVWGHGPSEGWDQDTVQSTLWLLPAALLNLDSPWGPCDLSWGRTPRPPGYGVRDPPSRSCPWGDAGGAPGRVLRDRPGSWVPRSAERGAVWTGACWLRVPRWPPRQRWPSSWERCSRTQSPGAAGGGCFCLGRLPWLGGPAAGRYLQPLFGPVAMAALVCFDVTMC